ncbi:site-specific integrase [Frankia sp. AgB1.9]|uniref:tyrosine-type recombinase/integrase n=1 Tax=unclassified Frankia TaxID=2632575 RepID=UPI001931FDC0|nr:MULTISPECIES: site-specific integrase [unclassified Frankia]MBL7487967.1 site-specific integrase [Frankia sp. AgW1.1]MBL7550410.1 site-specific integrase [Frankia sp. AgB1.9]MBL7620880.1 site-specific integrase [Frankia sp. AgB1.8]
MSARPDTVFKRCGCIDAVTGRQRGSRCPRLVEPGHGSWYFAVQVTTIGGRRARYRRGGFPTYEAANAARQVILTAPAQDAAAGAWTVARWLRYWLDQAEPHLRPSTVHAYRDHIDRYLIPAVGRITLADLTPRRLQACFDQLARRRTRSGTRIAPSTVDRVRATLRAALNAAVREGLITGNPLRQVRLDKPTRPYPVVWTDERVATWRRDGIRPPVAVWTLRQLGTFLAGVEQDRLAPLWWLIALRGLRRGEAVALHRDDLDAEARELTITRQLLALPGELYCGPPKSRASNRTIALDETGTRQLAAHALRQAAEALDADGTVKRRSDSRGRTGPGWRQGQPLFTYADGRPIRPEYLSHRFRQIVKELDLPPIRLHDLRHGAATIALASHTDLKVIQQMLGHSSIVTTADTYTSVLPDTAHYAAQATADMILTIARTPPGDRRARRTVTHTPDAAEISGYCQK